MFTGLGSSTFVHLCAESVRNLWNNARRVPAASPRQRASAWSRDTVYARRRCGRPIV